MRTFTSDGLPMQLSGSLRMSAVPLFHAAWLFAMGVLAARFLWWNASWVLLALAPVGVVAALAAFRAQRALWLPLAMIWFLLGGWCARMEPQPAANAQLATLSDGLLRTVEGTVTQSGPVRENQEPNSESQAEGSPAPPTPAQTLDLDLSSIEYADDVRDEIVPAAGRVRLTVRWPEGAHSIAGFRCGERLRADVRLRAPSVYRTPGAWNREDYLLNQGVTSTGSLTSVAIKPLGSAAEILLRCRMSRLQHAASARLMRLPATMRRLGIPAAMRLDEQDAAMIAAMIAGNKQLLDRSLRMDFVRTGAVHILVVSGANLAILAALVFWSTRRLYFSALAATLTALFSTLAYSLLTGMETPVQRALWMVTVYLLGRLLYREHNPLNTIGFATLVLLAASPRSLFDSSFQMTVLAVLSIGGVAAPLLAATIHPYLMTTRDLRTRELDVKLEPRLAEFRVALRLFADATQELFRSRLARRMAWNFVPALTRLSLRIVELIVVSCVVELAMTMPMAVDFHRVTLAALPVNLLILPLLSVLMPVALATLAFLAIWPMAAALPGMLAALLVHGLLAMVQFFARVPWGDLRLATPQDWQVAAFCILLAAAVVLAHSMRWPRRMAWAALVLAVAAAVAPRAVDHPKDALLAEAIDVGQGDSMLLVTPDGRTLLVDGGGFTGGPQPLSNEFDIGEEVVSPALWSRGIRRLDAVALSHAHSDHMGGLTAVLRNFRPAELWVGENPPSEAYNALLDEARGLGITIRALHAGDELSLGVAQVQALWPKPGYRPGLEAANNDSLVLRVGFGASSVQLEGDAEAAVEEELSKDPRIGSTLLKAGHHGSRNATQPEFLKRLRPQVAVLSCGRNNRFGHPGPETLEALEEAGVKGYRTDLLGTVCFALDHRGGVKALPDCSR